MAKSAPPKSPSARSSYLLVELDSLDDVTAPIKNSTRIKYTCLDVSQNYLVFGSTSGGIFVFQQETLAYLNTVTNKEGPIVQVALAPDDNILGFATSRGHVVVLEHNVERSAAPQRLQVAYEHRGAHVTCLQWNSNASQLFIGDDKGRVSLINVSVSRARNIFQVPTASLPKLDSKICQLDFSQDCLLVSTLTRCYLWDTNKQQFIQIGKKLRDGEYGACFYPGPRIQDPSVIFAARPGSRIWEVDMKGNVVCTHQFKQALTVAPKKIISYRSDYNPSNHQEIGTSQSLAFTKLLIVGEREFFVFAWSEKGVYIFDLKRAEVVLWNDEILGVKEVKCLKSNIFVSFVDGTLAKFSVLPVEKCIIRFFQKGLVKHSALLAIGYQSYLLSSQYCANIIASFLSDLGKQLSDIGEEKLARDVALLLIQLESMSQSIKIKLRSRPRDPSRKYSKVRFHGCSISDGDSPAQSPPRGPRARSASPRWPKTHTRCSRSSPLAKRRTDRLYTPSRLAQGKHDSDDSDSWNPRSTSSKSDVPVTSSVRKASKDSSETNGESKAGPSEKLPSEEPPAEPVAEAEVSACNEPVLEPVPSTSKVESQVEACAAAVEMSSTDHTASQSLSSSAYDWTDHVNGNVVLTPEKDLIQCSISSQDCGALADESSMATSIRSEELFGIETDSLLTPGDFSDKSDKMCLSLQEEILSTHLQDEEIEKVEEVEPQPSCSSVKLVNPEVTVPGIGEETTSRSEDSDDGNVYSMTELYGGSTETSRDTYMNLAMYGGGIFLPPVDFSLLQGEVFDSGKEELSKLKESISTKLTAGKKIFFKNLKDFETRIKQMGLEPSPELLDVVSPPNNNRKDAGKGHESRGNEQSKFAEKLNEYSSVIRFLWSALPPLDITTFMKISTEVRDKLHDPSIGYDSEKVQSVLLEWIEQLHELQKKICVLLGHILRATQVAISDGRKFIEEGDDDLSDELPAPLGIVNSVNHVVPEKIAAVDQIKALREELPKSSATRTKEEPCVSNHLSDQNGFSDDDSHELEEKVVRKTSKKFHRSLSSSYLSSLKEAANVKTRRVNQKQWEGVRPSDLLDLVFVHDPFHFTSAEHGVISELVRISFMSKVYGNIRGVENVLVDAVNCAQGKKSKKSLETPSTCSCDGGGGSKHIDKAEGSRICHCSENGDGPKGSQSQPAIMSGRRSSSSSSLSLHREDHAGDSDVDESDYVSSLFVKHYFHLLGASTVHSTIASRSNCQFRTWSVFVNSAQFYTQVVEFSQTLSRDDQLSASVYLLKQRYWDVNAFLFILKEICRISPKVALDTCLKRESRITSRDILYISKSIGDSLELFLSYADQVLDSASETKWHELFEKLFSCEEVRWEWVSAVLNEELTEKLKCDCGAPRPGAHLYPWKRGKHLEQAVLLMDECKKLTQMCFDAGFWPGYLQLLKMQNDTETHLMTVLELGDADLLSDSNNLGCVPSSKEAWKSFLQWMNDQQQPPDTVVCLMCGTKHPTRTPFMHSSSEKNGGDVQWTVTITWERVARILLDYFGAKECLQLFSGVDIPSGCLSSDFFQACILSHLMEKQQSALAYRMLAQLNSYLWSHRPTALSPQVYYLYKKEKSRRESVPAEDMAQGTSSGISDDALQLRFIEEPSSHWGVRTSLQGPCPLCGLSLATQLPNSNGIVAFHCGHSFHKACMDEEICFVCLCETSVQWDKSASEESS